MQTNPSSIYTNFLQRIQNKPLPRFTLMDLEGFPYEEYQKNLTKYSEAENWYDGTALEDYVQKDGEDVDLYPVRINPIPGTVEKHAHFLFGQTEEDDRPLATVRAIIDEDNKEIAEKVEKVLSQVWWENHGRAIQWENGIASQIYGGCVFHVIYDPYDNFRTVPIRIETVHPKYFVGIPKAHDMWSLQEAWVVQPITNKEALNLGVSIPEEEDAWLIAHYTLTKIDWFVNLEPAMRMDNEGNMRPLSGPNYWGVVPIVYIPHTRALKFYGDNIIDILTGVIKEMNLRVADFGDAVTVDSHAYVGMRNVTGGVKVEELAPNLRALNLGSNQSFTGHDAGDPDLFAIRNATASTPMGELVSLLYTLYRRLANLPGVVDGEDEGSQRSGLTLAMRMIALTSHTEAERIFWTAGLILLNRIVLRILMISKEAGVTIKHATARLKLEWSPILPRDREMIVEEAVALMGAKLGSPERLLDVLGVDNIPEEVQKIQKFWEWVAETEAKVAEVQAEASAKARGLSSSSSQAQSAQKAKESKN